MRGIILGEIRIEVSILGVFVLFWSYLFSFIFYRFLFNLFIFLVLFVLKVIFLILVFFGFIFDLFVKLCKEINKSEEGRVVSGKYWLDFSIFEIFVLVYCYMEIEGKMCRF